MAGRHDVAGLGPPQFRAVSAVQGVDELSGPELVVSATDEHGAILDRKRVVESVLLGAEPPGPVPLVGLDGLDYEPDVEAARATSREDETRAIVGIEVHRRRLDRVVDTHVPVLLAALEVQRPQCVVLGVVLAGVGTGDEQPRRLGATAEGDDAEAVGRSLPNPDGVLRRFRGC